VSKNKTRKTGTAGKKQPAFFVHGSSTVEEGAVIGEGTKIWYFCHVQKGARIGRNCILGQNVYIDRNVVIGDKVKIQNNVSVYEDVILEDEVFCGPSCVFTNVINPRSHIERKKEFRKTLVKKRATIGANATIVCGHTIGEGAFIGAGAVVTRDVPDFALVTGNPARMTAWMCDCGIKLPFDGEHAVCMNCGQSYTLKEGKVRKASS
jgi:UDP-2-acetamido-3-amino-2,3-dideoxy-glucuronate N-acetyltransferase